MSGLGYAVAGDPDLPTVVLLHGFMGSSADWHGTMTVLESDHRCVAVDLPGHGASVGLPPGAYTIEGSTRALIGVLDELDVASPAVVGYSMGGRLALYLALRHPERCSSLVLESASPGIESEADRDSRRRSDEEKAVRLEAGDLRGFVRDWYAQPLFASLRRYKGVLDQTIEARLDNDPVQLAQALRGMGTGSQPSLWDKLVSLRPPTLVIAGELDEKYTRISIRLAALNPHIRATLVPGAGHNVRLEKPEQYVGVLERFLSL